MEQYAELINVLNDLIRINSERITELKKRIKNLGNNSAVPLFKLLVKESQDFRDQTHSGDCKKGRNCYKQSNCP